MNMTRILIHSLICDSKWNLIGCSFRRLIINRSIRNPLLNKVDISIWHSVCNLTWYLTRELIINGEVTQNQKELLLKELLK